LWIRLSFNQIEHFYIRNVGICIVRVCAPVNEHDYIDYSFEGKKNTMLILLSI
jgi:hypothetical protein